MEGYGIAAVEYAGENGEGAGTGDWNGEDSGAMARWEDRQRQRQNRA